MGIIDGNGDKTRQHLGVRMGMNHGNGIEKDIPAHLCKPSPTDPACGHYNCVLLFSHLFYHTYDHAQFHCIVLCHSNSQYNDNNNDNR